MGSRRRRIEEALGNAARYPGRDFSVRGSFLVGCDTPRLEGMPPPRQGAGTQPRGSEA